MFGIHDFGIFLGAGLLLNLTPGQDTLYILGRSIAQGRAAGVASVLGISSGALVHTFAAALGLSAVLTASTWGFTALKLLGAAYLVFLGVRMLLNRASLVSPPPGFRPASLGKVYRQGLLTNALNPKVAMFFLAFLPQFIDADSPQKVLAFLTLGLCFVATGTAWCLALAWFAARISAGLRANARLADRLNRATGALFVFLGLRLAVAK